MKLRKGILLTALTLAAISILGTSNSVQAATAINSKTLNIKAVRSSGYGYKVVNNSTKYIWKIYNTRNDINETFYCIKGGPGFGSDSMDTAIGEAEYTEVFDMRKPSTITPTYRTPLQLIYGTKDYERLMWVLDQCYVPAKSNASTEDRKIAEDSKKALLDAVEAYAKKYPQIYENTSDFNDRLVDNLTTDDIDAIQQLAVWYYTNNDDYHVENNPTIQLGYQDATYAALNSNDDEDNARIHAMNALFDYLTKTPKAAGFSYDYETTGTTSSPVEIEQTNPIVEKDGTRYVVGPYKINQLRNITYTLNANFTDGNGMTIADVKFLNSNKTEMAAGTTIKDLVGQNFYISIPATTNATNIKMRITGNYFDTTINYWSVANPDPRKDQPVVQIEKGNKPITGEIDAQKEPDKEFDLALRKFIISVAGKTLTGTDSREPVITATELQNLANKQATGCNNTTAKKEHRKDALKVKTGDRVVYKIRVYNEGEIAGWATKVTDYLPEGLKFLPANQSTINAAYGWTNPNGDGKTIETTYLAGHKLNAFNGTTLDYEDLQIECEVIATPGATTKSLKNVAEITEHKDENGNTGTNLKDRDSVPGSLTPDQINNYGEEPNDYQDDDDFEHLILEPEIPQKEFDLALRKFITSIDGKALTGANSREPVITPEELQRLANKQATGIDNTSAKKEHRKDALTVQTGNKVVYTIRIYNEGEVDGWATEITDHLPSGLQFVPATQSTINATYGWTVSADGRTVTTNYLAAENKKINAFNGTNLDYEDVQIECEVIAVAGSSIKNLKNIAEITGNKDEDGNTNRDMDRDSTPDNLTDDQINNYGNTSKEDDDDFEDLKLLPKDEKEFDLALRKFISEVSSGGVNFNVPYNGKYKEYDVIGAIKIPKTNIEYPIFAINSSSTLGMGVAFANGVDPNQIGNATYEGQNSQDDKFFSENKNLSSGDEIYIKDETGKTIIYKVYRTYETNTDDFEYSTRETNGKREISLTTPTDDGAKRLIVLARESGEVTSGKKHNLTSREPVVDVKPLLEGKTTANYNHTKQPVGVSNNDIVTYTIRVYNEGQVDGYINEITDYLPPQLEFLIDDELNKQYGWQIVEGSNGRIVKTDITSPKTNNSANRDLIYAQRREGNDKVLLNAFGYEEGDTLDYIDVQIRCRVKENISLYEKITNIAEITEFTDREGNEVIDRDSQEENVVLPTDDTLPEYKDPEIESKIPYIPGQQDDDDFEKLVLQVFDLALRKFITGVTNGETTTDITNRAPVFVKNGNEYKYEHTKEPVEVANGNTVIYTLRIFNEGNVAGYASKVKDDLPEGLEFLPGHSINTAFMWKMYKEDGTETKDVKEAKYIETDFLSKEKEKTEKENLIAAFNPQTMSMPDYRDVKIAFKVTEPNTSDRIIINQAQISDDTDEEGNPVDDVDSTPDEWNEGEDDQDIEKIKVKYFDLSLKKWVTEAIVTVDGKTTVTKSGHTGNENPEPPMKVEIPYGKTNTIVVKFRFNIKVTNEGEIAGYAKEIEDYIPEGLKFVAKDNPKWKEKDGRVTTDQLKDKLLQPGESATVNIVLTWINGKNNMGEKVNWAEISKDENEYNSPDIDSTPGNKIKGEDDIDQAPVLLSPATGSNPTYAMLILGCTVILAGGIFLIKKFVI